MISAQVQLATGLKTLFENDDRLASYNELVSTMKYRPTKLPDFTNYAIIISPFAEREQHERHVNSLEYIETVQIIPIVRNYDSEKSVYGFDPDDGVGILQHVQNVKDVLRSCSLSGLITVTKHEFDEEVKFSEVFSENREFFYHEAPILYTAEIKDPDPMPEPHV